MSVEVLVPANFVSAGWGTPTVCARHGEPAVERKRTQFTSRRSGWLFLLGAIVYYATRKTVSAPAWPFCARCTKEYTTKTAAGAGSFIAGILIWVGSTQLLPSDVAPIGTLAGLVLFIGGAVVIARGGRPAIAGGAVTGDGLAVRFARAHEAFAIQAAAAQQAAAQQYATLQSYPAQPFAAQPFVAQPYAAQPYAAQPYAAQPGPGQPFGAQPYPAQPYPAPPFAAQQPFGAQAGTAQPLAAQPPYTAQPLAAQPGPAQPLAAQPGPAQPLAAQPGPAQPLAAQPGPAQPLAAQPGPAQPLAA
ncbi:hypothetical protein AB0M88_52930, partial [Actinoplanes sp. NPDC051411]